MNLGIYSNNYHVPAFRSNSRHTRKVIAALLAPAAMFAAEINGMSVGGTSERYTDAVDELATLVMDNSALASNESIIANRDKILIPKESIECSDLPGGSALAAYNTQKAYARLQVLNAYANDIPMQQNPLIHKYIGSITSAVKNPDQVDCVVKMLKLGIKNGDEKYLDSMKDMLKDNIQPELIQKVLSDEKLYKNIESKTLYNIRGTDKNISKRIIQYLNTILKDCSTGKIDKAQLNQELIDAFSN